jgi:hypothetical protein
MLAMRYTVSVVTSSVPVSFLIGAVRCSDRSVLSAEVISTEKEVVEAFHDGELLFRSLFTSATTSGIVNVEGMTGNGKTGPVGGHRPISPAKTVDNRIGNAITAFMSAYVVFLEDSQESGVLFKISVTEEGLT